MIIIIIRNINNYILKKLKVNVSQKIYKLQTTYSRDNTKQAEIPYFHCGPSRQEKCQSDQIKKKKRKKKKIDMKKNK